MAALGVIACGSADVAAVQQSGQQRDRSTPPAAALRSPDRVALRRAIDAPAEQADVELSGRITRLDDGGVVIATTSGGEQTVTWDRVRGIETDDSRLAAAWSTRRTTAEDMWRARSRLERGDHGGAAATFERLFDEVQGQTNSSALIVAEGLLRARIALGQRAEAVLPWLETLRLRASGVTVDAYLGLPPIVDPSTGLCWDLPPVFEPALEVAATIEQLITYVPIGAPEIADLARVYLLAAGQASMSASLRAEIASGVDPASLDELIARGESTRSWFAGARGDDGTGADNAETGGGRIRSEGERAVERHSGPDGVALTTSDALPDLRSAVRVTAAIVVSGQTEHAALRNTASATLTRYLDPERNPPDLVAWAYFGRGRARLLSIDEELQQLGLLDLLMLPARYGDVAPRLSRFALRLALPVLETTASPEAVQSMLDEFNRAHPRHALTRGEFIKQSRSDAASDRGANSDAGGSVRPTAAAIRYRDDTPLVTGQRPASVAPRVADAPVFEMKSMRTFLSLLLTHTRS